MRERYNAMLKDKMGLWGGTYPKFPDWAKRYGTYPGHQSQCETRQGQLKDEINKYNKRDCDDKEPIPAWVYMEADRATPSRPRRYEIGPVDRWLSSVSITDDEFKRMRLVAYGVAGVAGVAGGAMVFVLVAPAAIEVIEAIAAKETIGVIPVVQELLPQ